MKIEKKSIIFMVIIILLSITTSCSKEELSDDDVLNMAKIQLLDEFDNKEITCAKLNFYSYKKIGGKDVFFDWVSNDPDVISETGKVTPIKNQCIVKCHVKVNKSEEIINLRIIIPNNDYNIITINDTNQEVSLKLESIILKKKENSYTYNIKFDVYNNTDKKLFCISKISGKIVDSEGNVLCEIHAEHVHESNIVFHHQSDYFGNDTSLGVSPYSKANNGILVVEEYIFNINDEMLLVDTYKFVGSWSWHWAS